MKCNSLEKVGRYKQKNHFISIIFLGYFIFKNKLFKYIIINVGKQIKSLSFLYLYNVVNQSIHKNGTMDTLKCGLEWLLILRERLWDSEEMQIF